MLAGASEGAEIFPIAFSGQSVRPRHSTTLGRACARSAQSTVCCQLPLSEHKGEGKFSGPASIVAQHAQRAAETGSWQLGAVPFITSIYTTLYLTPLHSHTRYYLYIA